jgi:hypothetical protein
LAVSYQEVESRKVAAAPHGVTAGDFGENGIFQRKFLLDHCRSTPRAARSTAPGKTVVGSPDL